MTELGKFVPTNDMSLNKDIYCDLLKAVCNAKYGENGESVYKTISNWIEVTDFFEAPASSMFHENYPGGLVEHTLRVYNNMIELIKNAPYVDCDLASATLCTLVHDWCKIGLYKLDHRNVKNEQTGQWERVPCYKKIEPLLPLGHGVASMFMAMRFFNLTVEEALAIRWHMGAYHLSQDERNEYHAAFENYPMVALIHFADSSACTKYSV